MENTVSTAPEQSSPPSSKKRFSIPQWQQIIIASVLGALLGHFFKDYGIQAKYLGDIFLHAIQMTIVPLVFPLIVLGIANLHSGKSVGRIAFKAIVYFEIITTVLLIFSVLLVHFLEPGKGMDLAGGDVSVLARFKEAQIDFSQFLLHIIPTNAVGAMTKNDLLPILFFGIILGTALGAIGEKGKPVVNFLDSLCQAMFQVIHYVMYIAPVGVFGFVAYSFAQYGWAKVVSLYELIIVVWIGVIATIFVLFPIIAHFFRVPYFQLLNSIKDLILIVASTRSSETVLAPLIERLKRFGVSSSVVSFVLPMGYSFNLDGACVYLAPALLFVANAFGIDMSFGQQAQLVIVLAILSKGIAGVVGSNFVLLTSVAAMFNIPLEGVALLFAVDWITDIGRTATNVIGNSLATCVIARSEHQFRTPETEQESQTAA